MTAEPTIDYEGLQQEAMRGLVRNVLIRVAKSGLPGEHHFFISFDTEAAGVSLSKRLKEKYPREMTIVLQHRFWDLAVTDDRFEVKLTFDGIPERLVVPFMALRVFVDPSVRFGVQFEGPNTDADALEPETGADGLPRQQGTRPGQTRKPSRAARKPRMVEPGEGRAPGAKVTAIAPQVENGSAPTPIAAGKPKAPAAVPAAPLVAHEAGAGGDGKPNGTAGAHAQRADGQAGEAQVLPVAGDASSQEKPASGAEIVSLDKFRKK